MGAAGGETVGVTENRVCEQAPYMSRTGFEQACSEKEYEQASNSSANPAKLVVTFIGTGTYLKSIEFKIHKMYKM